MNDSMETSKSMILGALNEKPHQKVEESLVEIGGNMVELVFDFGVGTGRILEAFAQVGQQMGFSLIEEEVTQATLIKRNKKGLMDMLNCFNNDLTDSEVTAIKLTIKTNEINSTRVCRARGLVGSKMEVRMFLDNFSKKAKELRKFKSLYEQDIMENNQQPANPMHVQVCANYSFYKILSMENYGLGNKLAKMMEDYKKYGSAEQTQPHIPQAIQEIHNIVNWTVESLYKQFNSGRKEMERIMPYCRVSVQKFVCQKLVPTIYPVYQKHTRTRDEQFQVKRAKILNTRSIQDIFEDVCLSRKLWLVKEVPAGFKQSLTVERLLNNRRLIPFYRAAQQLQMIPNILSLREKIKHCELMYTSVKSAVFSYHSGREQLNNMEDILPVLMVIILITQIPSICCQIEMMNDFMSLESWEGETQKRLLINLRQSFNYIARDWKV